MQVTLYIYLAIYVAILIGVSWYMSRGESEEGFLIADRSRKWWTIAASKFAGAIGVGYFIAYTGYAYQYGLGVFLVLFGLIVGYATFALWAAPRIYAYSREKRFYTQGDFVLHKTGSSLALQTTNIVASIILLGWLLVGVVGGAKVISHFGLMSYEIALIATALVVISYIFLAGFRAVLATDILQAIIVFALVVLLTFIITQGVGLGEILSAQVGSVDIVTALGFFIFGSLSVYAYSNFYQLVYAAKSGKAASVGLAASILPIGTIAAMLLMIGMFMFLQNSALDVDLVFLEALSGYLPPALLPIGIVLFFAGLMSSADTNIYGIASHYVLSRKSERPKHDIRVATVILGVLSIVIGYFLRDVVELTILAAGFSVVLSIAMIYLISGGGNRYRFLGSAIGGVLGFLIGLAIFGIEPTALLTVLAGGFIGLLYNGWFIPNSSLRASSSS